MSTSINALVSGTFSTGATLKPVYINLPTGYDSIEITNLTDVVTSNSTAIIFAKSIPGALDGYAVLGTNAGGAYGFLNSVIVADGFTVINNMAATPLGAPIALTGISQANPAVLATATTTGIAAGDKVRVYKTTAMHQVSGMDFTVGTVVAGVSFQLAYLDASGFAAAATAGFYVKLPDSESFYPKARYITKITKAASAVVTLSVTHGYAVGEVIRMSCDSSFGMKEMDGLTATITAVDLTNNTITINVNSTNFTTFAFPTSAVADAGVHFPQVTPVGDAAVVPYGTLYDDSKVNLNFSGVKIGTGCLTAGKTYSYIARKGLSI